MIHDIVDAKLVNVKNDWRNQWQRHPSRKAGVKAAAPSCKLQEPGSASGRDDYIYATSSLPSESALGYCQSHDGELDGLWV